MPSIIPNDAPKTDLSDPKAIERHARQVVKLLKKFLRANPEQIWQG